MSDPNESDERGPQQAPDDPPAEAEPLGLYPGEAVIIGGTEELRARVVAAIQTCYDPEIPVDIYQLGLVYRIEISDDAAVDVDMTLTSPNCPVAGTLPGDVERTIAAVAGVAGARVGVIWDPPWGPERMSEAARLQLGMF
ncbi:MAG: iron-sulfur cluster assembly protein [Planctomycetota bacterium]|jgi:FeS assembly SUF system protein